MRVSALEMAARIGLLIFLAAAVAGTGSADAALPVCTSGTIQTPQNSTPAGNGENILAIVEQAASGIRCSAGTVGQPVADGAIILQENVVRGTAVECGAGMCIGGPTPGASCTANSSCRPHGRCQLGHFKFMSRGKPDSTGAFSSTLTVKHAAASNVGMRVRYTGARGYRASLSACINVPIGQATSGAWPMFHRDIRHNADSTFSTSTDTGTQRWGFSIPGFVLSSPTIGSDGTIYVGSAGDGNLYAINADGSKSWSFLTNYSISASPAVASDGTVYIHSGDGNLYAVATGTMKWSFATGGAQSSPVVGPDGTIYVGSLNRQVYAINPDGSMKWRAAIGGKVTYSSAALGTDGTVYIGAFDDNLYAIDASGAVKWSFTTGNAIESSPAIGSDGTIYVGSDDGNLYAVTAAGSKKWSFSMGTTVASSPAIGADGTIYVGSDDHNLYAINPDGTLKWKYATGNLVNSSPAISSDGTVLVGSTDGNLYAIDANGNKKWSFAAGSQILQTSPSIGADGTVYIGSNNGTLLAIH